MMGSYASAAALCLLLVMGCGTGMADEDTGAGADAATQGDSLFAFVQQIDGDQLVAAYASLADAVYTRYVRTEQFDGDGNRFAFRERTVRIAPHETSLLARDSAGSFNFGYLRRFADDDLAMSDPAGLAEYIVPDDPAYLSARSREVYSFSSRMTTLPGQGAVAVVEIQANEGEDAPIRRASLFLEAEGKRLVAIRVQRRNAALWFREESDLFLSIRRTANGAWIPHHARVETRLRMPLRPVQRFRTVSTFFDIENRPS